MFLEKLWSFNSLHFQCHNCHPRRLKVKCMDVVSEGHQQGGDTVVIELRPSQPDSVGPAPRLPVGALGFKPVPLPHVTYQLTGSRISQASLS